MLEMNQILLIEETVLVNKAKEMSILVEKHSRVKKNL
jgi:hypothetical protein